MTANTSASPKAVVLVSMPGFLLGIFSGGGGGIYVMQISIVILLLSLDQISGRGKSFQGEANCLRGAPTAPLWEKASMLCWYC